MLSVEKCNFSPRNFIFYTTNFIFYTTNFILPYRNLNYNKEKIKRNKDISWLPYCIFRQNKEKSDFSVRFDCHFCVKLSFIPVFYPKFWSKVFNISSFSISFRAFFEKNRFFHIYLKKMDCQIKWQ